MKKLHPSKDWPESWQVSYEYDLLELHGKDSRGGYASAYRNRRDHTLRLLTEIARPGARVLDVAAAQGNFSLTLAEMGYAVTWNDIRAELEPYVRMKHESGSIEFAPGNLFDLKVSQRFDVVVATEVIEHVAHPDEFLARLAELAAPGGYVILTTPNGAYFRNRLPKFTECVDAAKYEAVQFRPDADGHIFLLHPEELMQMGMQANLELEKLELFTSPLTNGHLKTGPLLRLLPTTVVEGLERVVQALPVAMGKRLLVQMGARFRKRSDSGKPAA